MSERVRERVREREREREERDRQTEGGGGGGRNRDTTLSAVGGTDFFPLNPMISLQHEILLKSTV